MNKLFASTLKAVLPLMVAIVFIYLFIYLIVQQNIRLVANEIPMQYALEAKEGGIYQRLILMDSKKL